MVEASEPEVAMEDGADLGGPQQEEEPYGPGCSSVVAGGLVTPMLPHSSLILGLRLLGHDLMGG